MMSGMMREERNAERICAARAGGMLEMGHGSCAGEAVAAARRKGMRRVDFMVREEETMARQFNGELDGGIGELAIKCSLFRSLIASLQSRLGTGMIVTCVQESTC